MSKYTQEQCDAMVAMYNAGYQAKRIADSMDLPSTAPIYNALVKAGVTKRQFPNISDSGKKYWANKTKTTECQRMIDNFSTDTVLDYLRCCSSEELAGYFDLVKRIWYYKGQSTKLGQEYLGCSYTSFDDSSKFDWLFTEDCLNSTLDILQVAFDMEEAAVNQMRDKINDFMENLGRD